MTRGTGTSGSRRHRARWVAGALWIPVLVGALVAEVSATEVGEGAVAPAWTRYGTGEAFDLHLADLDADGANEVLVGGRGVAALDAASLEDGHARWTNKWPDVENPHKGGDYEFVSEMEMSDITGDGIVDIISGTHVALHAIDGATGEHLWKTTSQGLPEPVGERLGAWEIALGDFDGDGVDDVAFASLIDERITGVRGRDGAPLWWYPRIAPTVPTAVLDMIADDVNGDGFTDVVVVGNSDPGFEVHAISGLSMRSGLAVPLWVQRFPGELPDLPPGQVFTLGGDPSAVTIGDVVPGGTPEVVVGSWGAHVGVLDGAIGEIHHLWEFDGAVWGLDAVDLGGAAGEEIIFTNDLTHSPGGKGYTVEARRGDGSLAWSLDLPGLAEDMEVADVEGDGSPEVVVTGDGYVVALDPSVEAVEGGRPRVLWERAVPAHAIRVAVGDVFGVRGVVVGADPGGVHAFAADGEPLWFFRTGGRVRDVEVADLDRDGSPEVVEVAGDQHVAVSDAKGALVWTRVVPEGGAVGPTEVATGDLLPDEGLEVAAGTFSGRIHAYSAGGDLRWSAAAPALLGALEVEDLDADGALDVVAANFVGQAGRWDHRGEPVWESRPLSGISAGVAMALSEVNGDGVLDVVVAPRPVFSASPVAALDGRTGEELWRRQAPSRVTWLSVTDDPADGIAAGDLDGHVYLMDPATGDIEWRVDHGDSTGDGEWTVDVDGDGSPDLVTGMGSGDVLVVSGVDGREIWRARPKEGDSAYRVSVVRSGSGHRVAVGGVTGGGQYRSHIHVVELMTGELVGSVPTEHSVQALAPGDLDGDGYEEVVAGAGWQVHAVRIGP